MVFLPSKIISLKKLAQLSRALRSHGKKIVSTNGCFDILHVGHVRCLEKAKSLGDVLVVGVNSDSSVRRLKGPGRPINSARNRAEVLAALQCVDYVAIFPQTTPVEFVRAAHPSIHVKGGHYSLEKMPETAVVRSLGGRVVLLKIVPGFSTSRLLRKLRG